MICDASETDRGQRLDQFLHAAFPAYSRSRLQEWIKQRRVLVNGEPQKPSYEIRGGESIQVEPAELVPLKATPEDAPLDILYEDEDLIAVNKPAGLVVHAGAGHHSGTLVNRLVHHFQNLSSVGGDLRPGIVHRLDRDTSGILLVARTDAAHQSLAKQFSTRTVEKIYLALVHGTLKNESGRIDSKITRDPIHRTKMTARLESGRTALTDYTVLKRLPRFTFVQVRIGTGRTHQIRVHLSSIGHPVAGDPLYGAPKAIPGLPPLDRYFLHAHRISFNSPRSGERIVIESPLPAELTNWMQQAERLYLK